MVSSPPSYLTAGADRLDSGVQTNTISVQTSTCDLSREATDKSERERKKKRKKHKKDKRRKSQMADPVVTDLMDGKGISVENSGGFYSDHGNAQSSGDENDIAERTFLLSKQKTHLNESFYFLQIYFESVIFLIVIHFKFAFK